MPLCNIYKRKLFGLTSNYARTHTNSHKTLSWHLHSDNYIVKHWNICALRSCTHSILLGKAVHVEVWTHKLVFLHIATEHGQLELAFPSTHTYTSIAKPIATIYNTASCLLIQNHFYALSVRIKDIKSRKPYY